MNVLISTYWNVNALADKPDNELTDEGFNLNLLECKLASRSPNCSIKSVLISTYWNVNLYLCNALPFVQAVLISTYWNVNFKVYKQDGDGASFNLNLLECKCERCKAVCKHVQF